MRHWPYVLENMFNLSRLITILAIAVATPVFADNQLPPGMYQQPPSYPAPLVQQTQPSYVPQSVAMSGPEEIDDPEDYRVPPPGYSVVHRRRKHLIVAGAVTLGVTYGVSTLAAAAGEDSHQSGDTDLSAMWIPVAGPFITMGRTDSAVARVLLAGLGGGQLAGAVMLYFGLASTHRVFVRNDLLGNATIVPFAGNGASGLALTGRF